mmetsp:Transcript_5937/g.19019  ORF Transcript_5937/g.19019 Transcript_5937/m.19019 type:complete len:265 (-) Transcript_5937:21-815(-)
MLAEWREVDMPSGSPRGGPQGRVELQELGDQVHARAAQQRPGVCPATRRPVLQALRVAGQAGQRVGPHRRPQAPEYGVDHADLGGLEAPDGSELAGVGVENPAAQRHRGDEAAQRPHVHAGPVLPKAEQELWRPHAECRAAEEVVSVVRAKLPARRHAAGGGKARDHEAPAGGDEDVAGLEAAVQHPAAVHVAHRAAELEAHGPHELGCQQPAFQVGVEVVDGMLTDDVQGTRRNKGTRHLDDVGTLLSLHEPLEDRHLSQAIP